MVARPAIGGGRRIVKKLHVPENPTSRILPVTAWLEGRAINRRRHALFNEVLASPVHRHIFQKGCAMLGNVHAL